MSFPHIQDSQNSSQPVSGEYLKPVTECAECGQLIGSVRELENPGTIFCGECALRMVLDGEQ